MFGPLTRPTREELQDFWTIIRHKDGYLVAPRFVELQCQFASFSWHDHPGCIMHQNNNSTIFISVIVNSSLIVARTVREQSVSCTVWVTIQLFLLVFCLTTSTFTQLMPLTLSLLQVPLCHDLPQFIFCCLWFLCSILQYMKQRLENRGRWVNNLQTTSVPGITLGLFSGRYIKDK